MASTSAQIPKSPGRSALPGPGEITTLSKPCRLSSSHVAASLRTTTASSPLTSEINWKRLYVYES